MSINMEIKKKDLKFGMENEKKVLKILKETFKNIEMKHYKFKYHTLDFYGKHNNKKCVEFELKSRNINHNKYNSLIFGKNKFLYSLKRLKKGIRQIYLFNCLDGIYYYELINEEKQKNEFYFGDICSKKRNDKIHDGIHIKIKYIKPLNTLKLEFDTVFFN